MNCGVSFGRTWATKSANGLTTLTNTNNSIRSHHPPDLNMKSTSNTFLSLPAKILREILFELDAPDLCACEQTSKHLWRIVDDSKVWDDKIQLHETWQERLPVEWRQASVTSSLAEAKDRAREIWQTLMPRLRNLRLTESSSTAVSPSPQWGDIRDADPALAEITRISEITPVIVQLQMFARIFESRYTKPLHSIEAEFFRNVWETFRFVSSKDSLECGKAALVFIQTPLAQKELNLFIDIIKAHTPASIGTDFYTNEGMLDVTKLQKALRSLATALNKQASVIEFLGYTDTQVHPEQVFLSICTGVVEKQLSGMFTSIITAMKSLTQKDMLNTVPEDPYLESVPSIWMAVEWFVELLEPPKPSSGAPTERDATSRIHTALKTHCILLFDLHIEAYIEVEQTAFTRFSSKAVQAWNSESDAADAEIEGRITGQPSTIASSKDRKSTPPQNEPVDFYGNTLTWSGSDTQVIKWNNKEVLTSFKKMLQVPASITLPFKSGEGGVLEGARPTMSLQGFPSMFKRPAMQIQPRWKESDALTELDQTIDLESLRASLEPRSKSDSGRAPNLTKPRDPETVALKLLTYKLEGIKTSFSLELTLAVLQRARACIARISKFASPSTGPAINSLAKRAIENIYVQTVAQIGSVHLRTGFSKALSILSEYKARHAAIRKFESKIKLQPLVEFTHLTNIADLIYQMLHELHETEILKPGYLDRGNQLTDSFKAKRALEREVDLWVGRGFGVGIEIVMEEIGQLLNKHYYSLTHAPPAENGKLPPSKTATDTIKILNLHTGLLVGGSTDASVLDVFHQELLLRFFALLCTNLKHGQPLISIPVGGQCLRADIDLYSNFINGLPQPRLVRHLAGYFEALSTVCGIYETQDPAELARLVSEEHEYAIAFQKDEVLEMLKKRSDWAKLKKEVLGALSGKECIVM